MSGFLGKTLSKIVGQKSREGSSISGFTSAINSTNNSQTSSLTYQQDTQLTLAHLRKVFYEYLHPRHELSQTDKDEKIYSLLPLFIRVRKSCVY